MSVPGLRPERAGRRAGWTLAGVALVLAGLAGAAPAHGPGTVLARLYPLDKAQNADGRRRTLPSGRLDPAATAAPANLGIAPLLRQLMADYAATGLPPAYLPQPQAEPHDPAPKEAP